MQIIEQIEQLSAVTVPAIQIYNLQHAGSMQIGTLLNRLYTQVLESRLGGVSITPLGKPNALLLIGRAENVQMAIQMIEQLDQPVTPTARFEVFPLRHASAAEAKALIDAFLRQDEDGEPAQDEETEEAITEVDGLPPLAPRAVVVADIRTNFLIVVASPRDLAEIAALLQRIDQPGAAAQLKVFTIRNGDATTLMNMLRTLFAVPEDAAEGAAGGGIAQGGIVRMQFSVDPRTNSIIAVGSADDLIVVEAILTRLDEGDIRERITTVHRLNNAFAEFLAVALNNWLQTQRQVEAEAGVTISPFEQFEREVIIVPEAATNSLIVSATPRIYNEVVRVIRELDERPPMVIIQVLIAEVRLNDTDEFGVELGLQDSVLFDRSLLGELSTITTTTDVQQNGNIVTTTQDTIVNAPGVPGFNFNDGSLPLGNNLSTSALQTAGNVAAQGLSNFSTGRWNPALGFSGFVFSASSDAVSVLLRALQENRRLEVLSRPQLMALDGQQGEVQVGQNVPRIVATAIDPLAGTINTIQYEPVGLILRVIPRISPDGLVVLQITAIKSEVGNEVEGIPISISPGGQVLRAPRIEITQAITTVSALSGQTVVLGGLLQTRKFDVHRRVPLIADIPLIGDLFRYDSVAEERRELLIILTPRIIYGKEDADLVKQIESSRMSWILGDVVALHGDAGLRGRCDEWQDADIEAVFPTYIPEEGVLPLSEQRMVPFDGMTIGPGCEPVMMPGPMMVPADGAILAPPNGLPTMITPAPTTMPATPGVEPLPDDPSQLPPPPLPPQTSILNGGAGERDRYGMDARVEQAAAAASAPALLMMPTEAE
jgi:type II secretion system protein D